MKKVDQGRHYANSYQLAVPNKEKMIRLRDDPSLANMRKLRLINQPYVEIQVYGELTLDDVMAIDVPILNRPKIYSKNLGGGL